MSNENWPTAKTRRGGTQDWITPRWIIESLGPFDLDPCASATQPWPTAARMISPPADGFSAEWRGRVWLNPPYGYEDNKSWLKRMADHGNGILLMFARTDTDAFHEHVFGRALAVFFMQRRIHFHYPDGTRAKVNGGAPSCLVAYSPLDVDKLREFSGRGRLIHPI